VLAPFRLAVEEELARILASEVFVRSERMSRFLRYVVGQALEDTPQSLKEFTIGCEVFDRDGDYDPRYDPVVRVEARRLRAKLAEYYDTVGRDDPILIEIPKGGYAVHVHERAQKPAATMPQRSRWSIAMPRLTLILIGALAVAAATTIVSKRFRGITIDSIAVLPFVDMSAERDQEQFCDGVAEELMRTLPRLPGVRLASRAAAFQFKGKSVDTREVGRMLNVSAVVEGTVRTERDRMRISVEFVRVADNTQLWGKIYERPQQDTLSLQHEIARAVTNSIAASLGPEMRRAVTQTQSESMEARDLYWSARQHHWRWDNMKAIEMFRQALAHDPGYALAHTGLADAYSALQMDERLPVKPDFTDAIAEANRALEIDPQLVEAHLSLAIIRMRQFDWSGTQAEFQEALRIDPNHAEAHGEYALNYLVPMRRLDEAVRESERCVELAPESTFGRQRHGRILLYSRKYDRAIAESQIALDIDPKAPWPRREMAKAYIATGRFQDAVEVVRGEPILTTIAYGYSGHKALAAQWHRRALATSPGPVNRVLMLAALGHRDEALELLERESTKRSAIFSTLAADPQADILRTDPRFQILMKTAGMAK
jgi:TolB-like protein/Tfp pilus assembly protein PilF